MRRLPSLIALRFFEETAQHLSFSRAATSLCVTQSAVSRQIRLLEDALGAQLFERDHKGVSLTDAGQRLLPFVEQAFDAIEHGIGEIAVERPETKQRLTVSLPPTLATQWFSPRLGTLSEAQPDVELSIRTTATDDCDCHIRFGRAAQTGMHSELLMMERHALVGAPRLADEPLDRLLARLPPLHVLHEGKRLTMWADWCAQAGIPFKRMGDGIEFSTLEQAIHAARKGAGLAIVDVNMIEEEIGEGSLVQLSPEQVVGPFGYWLDVAPENVAAEHVRAFTAWLREQVAERARPENAPPRMC
ncbi:MULTISPECIES: LysR substrate-binding domain-containing protein [Ralstonia]|jgi:LysR family glycine cleavage system transcriptional activator|uniref:Glycine cleavage system transcriptional activator n=1 Tax=Ralstonia flaminis TaxID=3058597 RepID=A0ABM9KD30_9RALS|nr:MULTISPECIES: LysR substrate-binding domain-containing protein [unclassified Ralstonia]CAJ0822518.1 Glycine cleavage system transcriptional activator [Ralstonia sp. LMG 18101]